MTDIIHLLPDNVANQIAAGEVIQRPASAVKELLENAVDAGATDIQLIIKDAGRTLIQVTDNGSGMSFNDARLCFERHATSKISCAGDLFKISTKGFRGEALASVAAIAHVELKTRRIDDELGTLVSIAGSEAQEHKPIAAPAGTSIAVKNLFFNVPARRNFLKSDKIEFGHIEEEFFRVALIHHNIAFSLYQDDKLTVKTPASNFKQRIINLMGTHFNDKLYPIEQDTEIIKINGFITKPENAKKKKSEQYLFINDRYVRHSLLNFAIESAYKELIPSDYKPAYFIRLYVEPGTIDINISPTKIDVKLQDERLMFGFLNSTVKKSIGAYTLTPQLDFESDRGLDMSLLAPPATFKPPTVSVNPNYNPFENKSGGKSGGGSGSYGASCHKEHGSMAGWEDFLKGIKQETVQIASSINGDMQEESRLPLSGAGEPSNNAQETVPKYEKCLLLANCFIVCIIRDVLTVIDSMRALERILYENYLEALQKTPVVIQQLLFPEMITLTPGSAELLLELREEFWKLGYDIEQIDRTQFAVNGMPGDESDMPVQELIEYTIENYKSNQFLHKEGKENNIALSLCRQKCRFLKPVQNMEEAISIMQRLFACRIPDTAPCGKKTIHLVQVEELKNLFH
ncbi:MAG: DNA mismatch repair endonuclease MutL [Bacteroidales bacterium]|jgi:DNA mismatch repair protein MutL|nr:DNA mismatch repair endonuclease MutL [Bacteroidales bacterium]